MRDSLKTVCVSCEIAQDAAANLQAQTFMVNAVPSCQHAFCRDCGKLLVALVYLLYSILYIIYYILYIIYYILYMLLYFLFIVRKKFARVRQFGCPACNTIVKQSTLTNKTADETEVERDAKIRKRLSIAVDIAGMPSLVFLDGEDYRCRSFYHG